MATACRSPTVPATATSTIATVSRSAQTISISAYTTANTTGSGSASELQQPRYVFRA